MRLQREGGGGGRERQGTGITMRHATADDVFSVASELWREGKEGRRGAERVSML